VSHIAPGDYQVSVTEKQDLPSAAFKSESIRSFFDQIYFETNQERLAQERWDKKYKSKGVGPGNYNLENDKKEFYKYQFFGSTE
jgi:hypothetical protein